jgi:GntR family transcriptional regulator / MocR family aminotransferase
MTEGLDLHLGVDKAAGFVGRALETALREAIRSGRLHPGARLPGSRSLAADLGISRGTVAQAYTQLIAEGWLTGTTGSGTRVADLPGAGSVAGHGEDLTPAAARLAVDLRPGRPDLSSFPRTDWATRRGRGGSRRAGPGLAGSGLAGRAGTSAGRGAHPGAPVPAGGGAGG